MPGWQQSRLGGAQGPGLSRALGASEWKQSSTLEGWSMRTEELLPTARVEATQRGLTAEQLTRFPGPRQG